MKSHQTRLAEINWPFADTRARYRSSCKAFTFVELLACIAAVALLCYLIVPVLARAKQSPQAALCLSNHKQLILAALMYADDNAGFWFANQSGQKTWVTDNLSWNVGDPNNINIGVLTNPVTDLFVSYIKSPRIFHCPGDLSRDPGSSQPRIRSVSANHAVGTLVQAKGCYLAGSPVTGEWLTGSINECDNTYRRYAKASDMVNPKPAQLFVFLDEHPNSLNDAEFAMQVAQTGIGADWIDVPASYHNGAVGISFADGHAEMHKWVGADVPNWPISWTGPNAVAVTLTVQNSIELQDLRWMQQRTSAFSNH